MHSLLEFKSLLRQSCSMMKASRTARHAGSEIYLPRQLSAPPRQPGTKMSLGFGPDTVDTSGKLVPITSEFGTPSLRYTPSHGLGLASHLKYYRLQQRQPKLRSLHCQCEHIRKHPSETTLSHCNSSFRQPCSAFSSNRESTVQIRRMRAVQNRITKTA